MKKLDILIFISDQHIRQCVIVRKLENIVEENWEKELIMDRFIDRAKNHHILSKWGNAVDVVDNVRWIVTEKAKELPVLI